MTMDGTNNKDSTSTTTNVPSSSQITTKTTKPERKSRKTEQPSPTKLEAAPATTPVRRRGRGQFKEPSSTTAGGRINPAEEELVKDVIDEGKNEAIYFDVDDEAINQDQQPQEDDNDSCWDDDDESSQPGAIAIAGPGLSMPAQQGQEDEDTSHNLQSLQHQGDEDDDQQPIVTTAKVVDEKAERQRVLNSATEEELRNRLASSNSNIVVVATRATTTDDDENNSSSRRKRQFQLIVILGIVLIAAISISIAIFFALRSGGNNTKDDNQGRSCQRAIPAIAGEFPRYQTIHFDGVNKDDKISDSSQSLSSLLDNCISLSELDGNHQSENIDPFRNGVWYEVTGWGVPLSASTCRRSNFDTRIAVFSGDDCGTLECLAYNDDVPASLVDDTTAFGGCEPIESSVTWPTKFNETYYILLGGTPIFESRDVGLKSDSDVIEGQFQLQVVETVQNDLCETASGPIPIDGTPINGSTSKATIDSLASANKDADGIDDIDNSQGVWYKVVGSDTPLVASTCHANTTFDTVLSVYHSTSPGSCAGNYTRVATNDDACGGSHSAVAWTPIPNEEYLIFIQGSSKEVGAFVLTVSDIIPNDFCETAQSVLTLPNLVGGTTENATEESNTPSCRNDAFRALRDGPGVWYAVRGTGQKFIASTCDSAQEADERYGNLTTISHQLTRQLKVYKGGGGCDELICQPVDVDTTPSCGDTSVSWMTEYDELYYILVHDVTQLLGGGDMISDRTTSLLERAFELKLSLDLEAPGGGDGGGFGGGAIIFYNNWEVPSSDATSLPDEYACVGDIVQFNWLYGSVHNVYIHPNNTCDLEDRVLVGLESGARYEFTSNDAEKGSVFFACDSFDHCSVGLHVTFYVRYCDKTSASGAMFSDGTLSTLLFRVIFTSVVAVLFIL